MNTYVKFTDDNSDSLTHYGVKGMKWRRRKGKALDVAWEIAHPISGRDQVFTNTATGHKYVLNQNRRSLSIKDYEGSKRQKRDIKADKRRKKVSKAINKAQKSFSKPLSAAGKYISKTRKRIDKYLSNNGVRMTTVSTPGKKKYTNIYRIKNGKVKRKKK